MRLAPRGRNERIGLAAVVAVIVGAAVYFGVARVTGSSARYGISGLMFAASDSPLSGAAVQLFNLDGKPLKEDGAMLSAPNGVWSVQARGLPAEFLVQARGGTIGGKPFKGTLRAVVPRERIERPVHLNPATTVVAAYVLRHRDLPFGTSELRVKQHLGINPHHALGESLRVSQREFDGMTLLEQAGAHGGLDRYVSALVDEIDAPNATVHPFPDHNRQLAGNGDFDAQPIIQAEVGGLVSKTGGALAGQLLNLVGLSDVSDYLGLAKSGGGVSLGDINTDLGNFQSELATISSSLTQVSGQLTSLQQSVAAGTYDAAINTIETAIPNVDLIGGTQLSQTVDSTDPTDDSTDPIVEYLAQVADDGVALTAAYADLPAAAQLDPLGWCNTHRPNAPGVVKDVYNGTNTAAAFLPNLQDCASVEVLLGDPSRSAGDGDEYQWCQDNQSSLASAGNVAYWSCRALDTANAYANPNTLGAGAAVDKLGHLLTPGTTGSPSLLALWGQSQYAALTGTGATILTSANYSTPQDEILSTWQSKLMLLGLYASLWDEVELGDEPTACAADSYSNAAYSAAQCDLAHAEDYATKSSAKVSFGGSAKPDIPAGVAVVIPAGGAAREWGLVQQPAAAASCSISQPEVVQSQAYYDAGDGSWEWGFGAIDVLLNNWLVNGGGQPFALPYVDCGAAGSIPIAFGTDTSGWTVPTASDLHALFAGQSDPGAYLTQQLGFQDLSSHAGDSVPPPIPQLVTLLNTPDESQGYVGYDTYSNPGTAYSLWTQDCEMANRYLGWHYFQNGSIVTGPDPTRLFTGWFCNTFRLADGGTSEVCLANAPGPQGCDTPVISDDVTPLTAGGFCSPITNLQIAGNSTSIDVGACEGDPTRLGTDYGHDAGLLMWREPSTQQYWYGP